MCPTRTASKFTHYWTLASSNCTRTVDVGNESIAQHRMSGEERSVVGSDEVITSFLPGDVTLGGT